MPNLLFLPIIGRTTVSQQEMIQTQLSNPSPGRPFYHVSVNLPASGLLRVCQYHLHSRLLGKLALSSCSLTKTEVCVCVCVPDPTSLLFSYIYIYMRDIITKQPQLLCYECHPIKSWLYLSANPSS